MAVGLSTIHVIDPFPASRAGLVSWLSGAGHTVVVGAVRQAPSGDAVAVVAVHDRASLDDITDLGLVAPALPVVAVLPEVDAACFVAALRVGAIGIATWDTSPDRFVAIIDAALAGQALLPSGFVRQLAVGQPAPPAQLTAQETRWLSDLAAGRPVAELAVAAGYSDRSMYRLLRKTYRSLNAGTRSEAIVEALRLGLL